MADQQAKIEHCLALLLKPDTEEVKKGTEGLAELNQDKSFLLNLLRIFYSDSTADGIRQGAAVEARKVIPSYWKEIEENVRDSIKEKSLEFTFKDSHKSLRRAAGDVVVAIAIEDFDGGKWKELQSGLFKVAISKDVQGREMALHLIYTLMASFVDLTEGETDYRLQLIQLLSKTIEDPESLEVRVNSVMIFGELASVTDPDEDESEQVITGIAANITKMVIVLQQSVDGKEEEQAMKCFEVFSQLANLDSAFFGEHYQAIIGLMTNIMANSEVDEDFRLHAIYFLLETITSHRRLVQRMKIGEDMAVKALKVVVELDEFDDDGERNPARQALALLDLLAENLPASQVVVPLMKIVGQFAQHEKAEVRRAGIMGLGMCIEGAPDFFSTQLQQLLPLVITLLSDSDPTVRSASLSTVSRLCEELREEVGKSHEALMEPILKNLDYAAQATFANPSEDEKTKKINRQILLDACLAVDGMADSMDKEEISEHMEGTMTRLVKIIKHDDIDANACAVCAIGSVAKAAKETFKPYFDDVMQGFGQFMTLTEPEKLKLRRAVTDAMGKIAEAVEAPTFAKYVQPLMQASEQALELGDEELRESSYILWSFMAKVYKEEFEPFLEGTVKGLVNCVKQEEELALDDETDAAIAEIMEQHKTGANRDKMAEEVNKLLLAKYGGDGTLDVDDIEDVEDLDDLDPQYLSGIAMEKEIAIEVIGDVFAHTKEKFLPYVKEVMELVFDHVKHEHSGVREAALGTLWRAYATLWQIEEEKGTMAKWQPGVPLKIQPPEELKSFGDKIMAVTLEILPTEDERRTVRDINNSLAEVLTITGPSVLTAPKVAETLCEQILSILKKQHECQEPDELSGDSDDQDEEFAEYDWAVIESAMDCLVGVAKAIAGTDFAEHVWPKFQKVILKYAGSSDSTERAQATGTMAECIHAMGEGVTPYTEQLMKVVLHRFRDEDEIVKGNAIYAAGIISQYSQNGQYVVQQYRTILEKLEPLLEDDGKDKEHLLDNAVGCVARMIIGHPDSLPLSEVLPSFLAHSPAKEDWEVNGPILKCLLGLYQTKPAEVAPFTGRVREVVQQVVHEPEDHIDETTRKEVLPHLIEALRG